MQHNITCQHPGCFLPAYHSKRHRRFYYCWDHAKDSAAPCANEDCTNGPGGTRKIIDLAWQEVCSPRCRQERWRRAQRRELAPRICPCCGETFQPTNGKHTYKDEEHRVRAWRMDRAKEKKRARELAANLHRTPGDMDETRMTRAQRRKLAEETGAELAGNIWENVAKMEYPQTGIAERPALDHWQRDMLQRLAKIKKSGA